MSEPDIPLAPVAIDDEIHFHTLRADGDVNCLGVLDPEEIDSLITALLQAKQVARSGDHNE